MGEVIQLQKNCSKNPEVKRPPERHRGIWEDNIKWILKKYVEEIEWIHLPQNSVHWSAFINTAIHICIP
jgi:hypothetical protein